jgi:hypothetical protein
MNFQQFANNKVIESFKPFNKLDILMASWTSWHDSYHTRSKNVSG